ncbi:MAG: GlxA family transcriptional regulator [Pseudomonadota bacterium]
MLTNNHEFGVFDQPAERKVGFFLAPSFAMLAVITAVEALRVANRISGKPLYSWHIFSKDGEPVTATNGMQLPAEASIEDIDHFPMVVVCGAHTPHHYNEPKVCQWLRSIGSQGAILGAIDTGTYLLAQAGLVKDHRCTIHWLNIPGLKADFPKLIVTTKLFEDDRGRLTCAGGSAAMDMFLHMIEQDHGTELAVAVSENFILDHIRQASHAQRMNLRERTGISNHHLLECIELMEANIEQPLMPSELANAIGISKRQLERLFQRYLGCTPSGYYTELRLIEGRRLLIQTSLKITDIALACGFPSPGYFSNRYRSMFGYSPRDERNSTGTLQNRMQS